MQKRNSKYMQHINILIKIFRVQSIEEYGRKTFERLFLRRLKSFRNRASDDLNENNNGILDLDEASWINSIAT